MTMSDCILPNRKTNSYGYVMMPSMGRYRPMHRVAYEIAYGPIADGLVIDHECHNEAAQKNECKGGNSCKHRACINPQHLVAKTHLENVTSGLRVMKNNFHCKNGHEVESNLAYRPSGRAYCLSCRKESSIRSGLNRSLKEQKCK